jgi:hypothetical protein
VERNAFAVGNGKVFKNNHPFKKWRLPWDLSPRSWGWDGGELASAVAPQHTSQPFVGH